MLKTGQLGLNDKDSEAEMSSQWAKKAYLAHNVEETKGGWKGRRHGGEQHGDKKLHW